ncbi:cyanate hydratase, partial [Wuchereria bancrofti]
ILATKVQKGVTWKSVAEKIGKSKEWTTAACLGQMVMSKEQAEKVAEIFDLPESALLWLQTASQKGRKETLMVKREDC